MCSSDLRNNGLGGSGVAPSARLAVYNAISTGSDEDIADALRRDQAATHIYHNSWGSPDDGALHPTSPLAASAMADGLQTGRNGRGSIFVFASGNGGARGDMTAFDGYLNLKGTLTACAVNRSGQLPSWGEQGENILVCGLSGDGDSRITTTGIRNGYRSDFGGASAAAPMVTGVIALMLEANPALGWRDVRWILAQTARENYPTDNSWAQTALLTGSGQTKRFSRKYGFGVADAAAAVAAARTWTPTQTALQTCTVTGNGAFPIALADATAGGSSPSSNTVAVGNDCSIQQIEFVEVLFSAQHDYSGDLRVLLTSPSHTESRLADPRICGATQSRASNTCGNFSDWRFLSNRHLAENPSGNWTLTVTDERPDRTGSWLGWTLIVSGR